MVFPQVTTTSVWVCVYDAKGHMQRVSQATSKGSCRRREGLWSLFHALSQGHAHTQKRQKQIKKQEWSRNRFVPLRVAWQENIKNHIATDSNTSSSLPILHAKLNLPFKSLFSVLLKTNTLRYWSQIHKNGFRISTNDVFHEKVS